MASDAPGGCERSYDEPLQHDLTRQDTAIDFAPAALSGVRPARGARPPVIEVRFMGLLGPNGPLPLHLTEFVRDRERNHGDASFARFADVFHHRLLNSGETLPEAFDAFMPTWDGHGTPMMDYSTQHPDRQPGTHTQSIDLDNFAGLLDALGGREVDIMLEIKDKEVSALRAMEFVAGWAASEARAG